MAGKIIVDTIDTDNSFITLNVQQSLIATMNVSGIYSNTGVKMIGANGSVSNTAITGLVTASQIATVANTQITGNIISSQITSNPTLYGNVSVTGVIAVGGATPTTNGSGITFPATQSASSDANTLDDYEEGTWTPAITFGGNSVGVTYHAYNAGYYTKVGRLVTLTFILNVTNKGSSTGSALITGAPFSCINAEGGRGGLAIGYTTGITVNNPNVMFTAGSSSMGYRTPNGGDLDNSNFSTGFTTYASYSYFIT